MNKKNSEQKNNGINNETISSAKILDNQNLSKEIKIENEQSYDVRNRDITIIADHSEQWNNGINNEEISSSKTLDNQNLSKEIKMENEQSYDVRNRDNTFIYYHSELQRRKLEHSNYQADTAESMDRKKVINNNAGA